MVHSYDTSDGRLRGLPRLWGCARPRVSARTLSDTSRCRFTAAAKQSIGWLIIGVFRTLLNLFVRLYGDGFG